MQWFRRRQRDLTRLVLVLFALAWLQVATVPCAMADWLGDVSAAAAHHGCQYCPPQPSTPQSVDSHAHCLYPHGPQVDSRSSAALYLALPAATPMLRLMDLPTAVTSNAVPLAVAIARPSAADSYCRRIE